MIVDGPTFALGGLAGIEPSTSHGIRENSDVSKSSNSSSNDFAETLASISAATKPQNVTVELSAAKKFEAAFVAQMMANILPKDSDYFGEGFAGDAWRSMLSEQIANVAVTRTDFGIAPLIESGYAMPNNSQSLQSAPNLQPDLTKVLTRASGG